MACSRSLRRKDNAELSTFLDDVEGNYTEIILGFYSVAIEYNFFELHYTNLYSLTCMHQKNPIYKIVHLCNNLHFLFLLIDLPHSLFLNKLTFD